MSPLPSILIVDDDHSTIRMLSRTLEGMGEIHSATSGVEALEIVAQRPIDLVLLDAMMPEMDGFATCRAFLQDHPDLPVIFVTAATEAESEIQALSVGARDFIGKPVNPLIVRARVALHLKPKVQDSERRRAVEQLRIGEQRLRLLADNLVDNVWIIDRDHRVIYINPAHERLTGFSAQEYQELSLAEQVTPGSLATIAGYFEYVDHCTATGLPAETFRGELELWCKDGSTCWTETTLKPLLDSDGNVIELVGVARDIRQRSLQESELNRQVATDLLTGALTRTCFEQAVTHALKRRDRRGEPLSLVLFDIDRFKSVNERFGRLNGDQVLVEFSQLVRVHLRATDLFARWGGGEFVVMLPNCTVVDAERLAEKLCALIADHPFSEVGTVTSSFGVAELLPDETRDEWLERADAALSAAKSGGRNRVCTDASE